MERKQQRTLQELVIAACDETFTRSLSFLVPIQKNIVQMKNLNATISVRRDNHTKLNAEFIIGGPLAESGDVAALYRKRMNETLIKYNSQTKYIDLIYNIPDGTGITVRLRLTNLRSRYVKCTVSVQATGKYFKKPHQFVVADSCEIGQFVEDGPITLTVPWYIRMLSWLATKLARPNPQETWK